LSGCPSVTDSEVNKRFAMVLFLPFSLLGKTKNTLSNRQSIALSALPHLSIRSSDLAPCLFGQVVVVS
jgi:hypothetical protein